MRLRVDEFGLTPYREALRLQKHLQQQRLANEIDDTLLLMEHPPTVTEGARNARDDFVTPVKALKKQGFDVVKTRRGGHLTYHGPGQLVAYPIVKLPSFDVRGFVENLQTVVTRTLDQLGLSTQAGSEPGVYVEGKKVGWIGLQFRRNVSRHGLALNVDVNEQHYEHITPCNDPEAQPASLSNYADVTVEGVRSAFRSTFVDVFGYDDEQDVTVEAPDRKRPRRKQPDRADVTPSFLTVRAPGGETHDRVGELVESKQLNTVCEEASCPNIGECWSSGTATFMLLGDTCTRSCGFCDVKTGMDADVDPMEPARVAHAVEQMELDYAVLTSVNRDDLPDGGAEIWAKAIRGVRETGARVEALVPDFEGDEEDLRTVIEAGPDVLNHNIETVPRLYQAVRPGADYEQSLRMLEWAADRPVTTKSGLMLGLGERRREVLSLMTDLREHGVELLTVGQYMRPDETNLPVQRHAHPVEYERYAEVASELGFKHAECGPLVRSSYRADRQIKQAQA